MHGLLNLDSFPDVILDVLHDLSVCHQMLGRDLLVSEHWWEFGSSQHVRRLESINMALDISSLRFIPEMNGLELWNKVIRYLQDTLFRDVSGIYRPLSLSICFQWRHWGHSVQSKLFH